MEAGTSQRSASSRSLRKGSCSPSGSSSQRHPISTSQAAGRREGDDALAALLRVDHHAQLPIGLLVYDADSFELVHVNPTLLRFAGPDLTLEEVVGLPGQEHDPQFPVSELASALAEVAATGKPQHLPEFRHDFLGRRPRWWSASLHQLDTDRWGEVVVALVTDLTDQVRARHLLEEREERRLLLQQTIASVPGENLMASLQSVADALVAAFPVDASALRLLDADSKLHLIAATGLRPAELRRLAFEPVTVHRLEAISEGGRHPLVGSLGLRWVEIRWLRAGDERIGAFTVGARRDRRLSDDDLALLDVAAAELGAGLERVERSSGFLRKRSLELGRSAVEEEAGRAGVEELRPRELTILRLYAEGLETHQIAELLVLSVHTVRTHVKNARRRLGVGSRREALERLKATDADPAI